MCGYHGRDHMIVGFKRKTTYAISAYRNLHCEFESSIDKVYSIQQYV